jgi:hypothetical protein
MRRRALMAIALVLAGALPVGGAEEVTVTVTDKVAGGTVKYIGGYLAARALRIPEGKKALAGSEINCTKLWLPVSSGGRKKHWEKLCGRKGDFYGDDYREYAIRQVTEAPDTINWKDEIMCDPKSMTQREKELKILKDNGIEPVLNIDKRIYDKELTRRAYWRYTFLLHCYLNKMKKYHFVLWEFGCEDSREGPEQLRVGSDAVREAVKLTGVPVLVAGPGDDGDVHLDFPPMLQDGYDDRFDAISFHSFQYPEDFPLHGCRQQGRPDAYRRMPIKKALLGYFDGLQKKLRPGKSLFPYWDTGWTWRTAKAGVLADDPLTAPAYIGRLIAECESRVQVNLYSRLYSPYHPGGGTMETTDGKFIIWPLFYAMRMMARANAGEKERLEISSKPEDAVMQSLATRSGKQVFITCLSRRKDAELKVRVNGLASLNGQKYEVRRQDLTHNDDVIETGTVNGDVIVALPPLGACQVVIARK